MYKKAGIVVGILLIVAAIAIYLIVSSIMNKRENEGDTQSTPTSQAVQSTPTQSSTNTPSQSIPIQTSPTQPIQPSTSEETSNTEPVPAGTSIVLLDAEKLPAYADVSDVGTIVGHNVYSYSGQVIFGLLINTTTNGQIEYFTSLKNFQLEDGTRLNCELRVYTSNSGNYPSIISISVA